jgi:hypothetical protein
MLDQHQSLNGFSYANNTPVTSSDPTGLCMDPGNGHCQPDNGGMRPQPPDPAYGNTNPPYNGPYDGTRESVGLGGTARTDSSGQTLTSSDGQVLACAYGHCIGNVGPSDIEQNVGNYLKGSVPDGPLVDLLQGQTQDAWDELAHGCEKDEPEICAAPKTGTIDAGFGPSLLSRAGTKATSKLLAAQVEVLYAKKVAGKTRAALAGLLEVEGRNPQILLATSSRNEPAELVPLVGGKGNPARFKATPAGNNPRTQDTEYKMLTYIANQLGEPSNVKGSLTLHSSQAACTSCTSVIGQFAEQFPNIRINYTSGRP